MFALLFVGIHTHRSQLASLVLFDEDKEYLNCCHKNDKKQTFN